MSSQEGSTAVPIMVSPTKVKSAMTPEEFSLETRFVMLNFLGLVPLSQIEMPPGIAQHSSHTSSSSGSHRSLHSRSSSGSSHTPVTRDTAVAEPQAFSSAHSGGQWVPRQPGAKLAKSKSLPYSTSGDPAPAITGRSRANKQQRLSKTKSVASEDTSQTRGERFSDSDRLPELMKATDDVHRSHRHRSLPTHQQISFLAGELSEKEKHEDSEISLDEILTPLDTEGGYSPSSVWDRNKQQSNSGYISLPQDPLPVDNISSSGIESEEFSLREEMLGPNPQMLISDLTASDQRTSGQFTRLLSEPTGDCDRGVPRVFTFEHRARSQSPARPTSLDLQAPRSPATPHWKELVASTMPSQWDHVDDDVDMTLPRRTTSVPFTDYESGSEHGVGETCRETREEQDLQQSGGDRETREQQDPQQSGGNRETREQQDSQQSGGNRETREQQDSQQSGGNRETREQQDSQQSGGNRETREQQDSQQSGGNRETREQQDSQQSGGNRETREQQDLQQSGGDRDTREQQDSQQSGGNRETREQQDPQQSGENRETREQQDPQQSGGNRETREQQDPQQSGENRETREQQDLQQSGGNNVGAHGTTDNTSHLLHQLDNIPEVSPDNTPQEPTGSRPVPLRQDSNISTVSTSLPSSPSEFSSLGDSGRLSKSSQRTSLIDLDTSEIITLVNSHTLPAVAASLKEELTHELEEWEMEYEEGRQNETVRELWTPTSSVDSPESEVARQLGVIGDQVQEEYGDVLNQAMHGVMCLPRERVTYEVYMNILLRTGLISTTISSWQQVAVLMLFSQRLVLKLLQQGERHLGCVVDFTVRTINDRAASFIINQGGWGAISELDLGSPVSISDVTTPFIAEHEMPWDKLSDGRGDVSGQSEVDGATMSNAGPADDSTKDLLAHTEPQAGVVVASTDQNDNQMNGTTAMNSSIGAKSGTRTRPNMDPVKPSPAQIGKDPNQSYTVNGQLTPEEAKVVEEAINSLRPEIQLIRQVSSDLRSELETGSPSNDKGPGWPIIAAYAGVLGTLALAAVLVYKSLRRTR